MWTSGALLILAMSVIGVISYGQPPRPPPPTPQTHRSDSSQAHRPGGGSAPWSFDTKPRNPARPSGSPRPGAPSRSGLWNDLRVTYSPDGEEGGYFRLPRTAEDALGQGYVSPQEEQGTNGLVGVMCPPGDPSVCVLFDGYGNVAGLEIGVMEADVRNNGYPFKQHPAFVPRQRFGYNTYITTLYFVDQGILSKGGRQSIIPHGTGTGVWLKNGPRGSKLFEIPLFERDLRRTPFKQENCVPGMGGHYYYNMSTALRCEDLEPIFGLYSKGQLIGFGYKVFGRATPVNKVWFEAIPVSALQQAIPDSPQCLIDKTQELGLISMHVYLIDKPWDISCDE